MYQTNHPSCLTVPANSLDTGTEFEEGPISGSVICINKQTACIVIQFLYRPCIPNSTGQRNFKNQNLNPITELFRKFDHHLGRIPQIYQLQPLQSTVNATSSVSMGFPTFLDPQEVSRTYGAVPVQEPATPPRVFRR